MEQIRPTTVSHETVINCDCGAHMLKIQSEKDFYTAESGEELMNHEFYLAMFQYGMGKDGLWRRFKVMWNYLRTGKYFSDQLCMTPDEAKKLTDFIRKNLVDYNK